MRRLKTLMALMAFLILTASAAWAQTPSTAPLKSDGFVLEKIALNAVIDGQKARCTLQYIIYNPANHDIEVDFLAPLPQNGALTGLTLFNGQQELAGEIYAKDEALRIYREIVNSLKDPALLEYAGNDTFRARVFPVPAKGRQTLELSFDYLVTREDGQLGFDFPLAGPMTRGFTPETDIHVVIKHNEGVSNIYTPLADAKIANEKGRDAVISYNIKGQPVLNRFLLYFKTGQAPMGGLVLSHKPHKDEDGFFLFLADPVISATTADEAAKNVIFALDKSGSMSGAKFEQAREALRFILERLNAKDSFNLVDYNGGVFTWQPELMDMSPQNREQALAYVDNLRAGGNTHIEGALKTSFGMITDPKAPNYIIFLTDGQPTSGETREMRLAEIAAAANPQNGARLFAFGVGYDVNARLLDRLSGQAGGSTVFVNPDENLEAKVAAFFARITSPALTRPQLNVNLPVNSVLPQNLPDLFSGQQMVVVGRYAKGGQAVFTLKGRAGDKEEAYTYTVNLAEGAAANGDFIAGIWAQRRIGELIDEIDLAGGAPSPELVEELVRLSKQYGILTPYTSFLALEDQALTAEAELSATARDNFSIISQTAGASANKQRALKGEMKAAKAPAPAMSMEAAAEMVMLDQKVARAGAQNLNLPKQWAGQTFFYKNGQWQAQNLTEKDLAKPVSVKQLSDEYFALAATLKPEEMVWLTQKEPVVFNHNGITYLIEP